MRSRWLLCIVLLGTVLSVATTSAAIIVIDPTQPPQQLLAPEELEKLAQLQQPASFPFLLSSVSPDDQALLSVEFDEQDVHFVFSNINDGTTVAVDDRILDLSPFTELVWRDATTLTYFSTEIILNPDGSVTFGDPQQVLIDRTDGSIEVQASNVPVQYLVSLAPNASRAGCGDRTAGRPHDSITAHRTNAVPAQDRAPTVCAHADQRKARRVGPVSWAAHIQLGRFERSADRQRGDQACAPRHRDGNHHGIGGTCPRQRLAQRTELDGGRHEAGAEPVHVPQHWAFGHAVR